MAITRTDYSNLQLCAMRVTLLDDDGSPLTGPESVYTLDSVVSIGQQVVVKTGDSFEQVNGCGAICATAEDCDRIKGTTNTVTLCHLDAELIYMMTGGTVLTDGADNVIGLELPGVNDPCPNGYTLEGWSKAWDEDSRALDGANPLWIRHYWPKQVARLGDYTLENGLLAVPILSKGSPNTVMGAEHGPHGDWPDEATGKGAYGWFLDTTIVEPVSGPTAYPTVS